MPFNDKVHFEILEEDSGKLFITDGTFRKRGVVRRYFLRDLRRYTTQYSGTFPLLTAECFFCGTSLRTLEYIDVDELDPDLDNDCHNKGALEVCVHCSYWRYHRVKTDFYGSRGVFGLHSYTSHLSKVHEYEELPEGCLTEIAQQMRVRARHWHSITPIRLERLVRDIFKANYGSTEVIHVGKPGDGGVDVLLIDSEDRRFLIQVKRREDPASAEGVNTVRNLLGTMMLENSRYGIVVSTADHFTYRAYEAVGRANECGMTIRLVDRGLLNRMLDPLLPDRPWLDIIDQDFPDFANYLARKIPSSRQRNLFSQDLALNNLLVVDEEANLSAPRASI